MRDTTAGRHQLHAPATTPDRLKPRRGGLFIATNTRGLFFLFFGGAALATTVPGKRSALNHAPGLGRATVPRRRKTRRSDKMGGSRYTQATPTGFGEQADSSQCYVSTEKMWVMTRTSVGSNCAQVQAAPLSF